MNFEAFYDQMTKRKIKDVSVREREAMIDAFTHSMDSNRGDLITLLSDEFGVDRDDVECTVADSIKQI
jgi:acyl-CoA reductase-like NAD-dependent aldehyde dehydrogenase